MRFAASRAIADAVLYEGLMLYPYRPSALKNQYRWLFGVASPSTPEGQTGRGPSTLSCEFLVQAPLEGKIEAVLRFLHPPAQPSEDATLRQLDVGPVALSRLIETVVRHEFEEGSGPGVIRGLLELGASSVAPSVYRLRVAVTNLTGIQAQETSELIVRSMVSTQVLVGLDQGEFIAPRDPPAELQIAAAGCENRGLWPILLGERGRSDTLLCSPIILDDYPQVAPESPGDFFDATEIDELLTLRILTLTPDEKREMAAAGSSTARLLERTEELGLRPLDRLHGAIRSFPRSEISVKPGDRVRLRPSGRSDIFDLALAGRLATVQAIELDYDGRRHVVVTVDDDPGKDLGEQGQPGHQFFFAPHEVEAASPEEAT